MKPPRQVDILAILDTANWNGHVELPDCDRAWLARVLAAALNPTVAERHCVNCGHFMPVTIKTPLGRICSECIEQWNEEAEEIQEEG